ncbi:endospore germination permease [Heyndrickxia oleronia]|uniref:endospore germination permease n=1 Tax=Heyndrickxia oleronia TaxID=38875 RepID=UPI00203B0ECD|nr:endospore germination permease [Heyndrickxia oleronia]MCM3240639.1 endospore germination permease [Heyndrickxia oleronia]
MNKINISQLFAIFLLSTGLNNHVIVIPLLIDVAGRDAWISVIIGYVLSLVFSLLLLYVTKQVISVSLFEWLSSTYSQFLSRIIAILMVLFLITTGWITLKETTNWTNETYLLNTPVIMISLFILAAAIYISIGKLKVIAMCAGVILPLVIALGIFVSTGTFPDKNYKNVAPVLVENGWEEVFHGSIFVLGSLIEIILLILLQHQLTQKLKFKHLVFLTLLLSVLTAGPLLGSIAVFGVEEAEKLRYPAFYQWRILRLGNYFNHLDFFSIYQWLSSAFIRITIVLFLITQVLNIKKKKQRFYIQAFICIIYLLLTITPISDEAFYIFLVRFYYIGSIVFSVFITLFLATLMKFSRNKRRSISETK